MVYRARGGATDSRTTTCVIDEWRPKVLEFLSQFEPTQFLFPGPHRRTGGRVTAALKAVRADLSQR